MLPVATAVFAGAIFIADAVTHPPIAVGVLYVGVVLLAARFSRPRTLVSVSAGCVFLTVLSFFTTTSASPTSIDEIVNTLISIAAIVMTSVVVLQSRSAETTLRQQASLLDLTHDTIFSRGMDDRITYWNRGAEELYGWSSEEALGRVSHELLRTKFPAPLSDIVAELRTNGRWEGELVHTRRDGTPAVVNSRWSLQRDKDGLPTGILETNNDITQGKRAQEALAQAETDLARVNRVLLLGEMTASIAHEVNQPISAGITNANAALRWLAAIPPNLDEARQALQRIVTDGHRASDVIHRIRALVKKAPSRRDRMDLNEAIRDVIALTHREFQRTSVTLRLSLPRDLPAVLADRVQVQQVIINLILNAVDAMSDVEDRPRELTILSNGNGSKGITVEVQDTGVGLEPAHVDRLFQSFYTTKPDGMGMGLAICRSIVEAHGGSLSAAPNEPHGARFWFTLPVEA